MLALAREVGLAGGPASGSLQGKKPRSAGRALGKPDTAMGIAAGAEVWAARVWAVAAVASVGWSSRVDVMGGGSAGF